MEINLPTPVRDRHGGVCIYLILFSTIILFSNICNGNDMVDYTVRKSECRKKFISIFR